MATDVDVQYFSHLNGLTLGNNWGDLIRLLDTCLVNGLALPSVTSASIDAQGDITLNLYAAHNCQLFQIVEVTGFNAVSLGSETRQVNGKYRIKGLPSANQLILKGIARTDTNPSAVNLISIGSAKLASLGYEIIFRDSADVKRVYRAKNPRAEHPFIRVDETISDETNSYASDYAKYAMVGLIENMTHIDDYEDTSKLQLPLDAADFSKNWKINGVGESVVRGWSRWHYSRAGSGYSNASDTEFVTASQKKFSIIGDKDAFYFVMQIGSNDSMKFIRGCGIYESAIDNSVIPPWFLLAFLSSTPANAYINATTESFSPFCVNSNASKGLVLEYTYQNHPVSVFSLPILPDFNTGYSNLFSNSSTPALQIPVSDSKKFLRGVYKHIHYAGKLNLNQSSPLLSDNSMYLSETVTVDLSAIGSILFYLGELE